MVATTIGPIAGFAGFLLGVRMTDNVHVIESGLAYRSGRLWPGTLDAVIEDYGIRSIINLSSAPDQYWYRAELAISAARNVVRFEMPLSARDELTAGQLRQLLSLLQRAPKPVLIQSESGADRSGLAAAILEYAIALRPFDEAINQLSIRYGHFPPLWSGTDAMDASFRKFLLEHRADVSTKSEGLRISESFR